MYLTRPNRRTEAVVILKDVPLDEEESLQIRILEKLAISLVALIFPTSNLTGLVTRRVREALNSLMAEWGFHTLSQYQKKPHLEHFFKGAAY